MGHRVYFTSSLAQWDTLRSESQFTNDHQSGGDGSLAVKHVSTMVAAMPVRVACNTISSLVFGGSVRGWTVRTGRRNTPVTYDVDVDDWRTYLDRQRPIGNYTSIRVDSLARALVSRHTSSFTVDISSYFNAGLTSDWPYTTTNYYHDCTLSEALDSLTQDARTHVNYDQTNPPVWGVGADRVVRMVGYASSYGTTVTVDDTDADLRAVEVGMVGNQLISRMWVWGGSTTAPAGAAAGVTSLLVDDRERFYGNPSSLSIYAGAAEYLANGAELIPVVGTVAATGGGYVGLSSLNICGVQHAAIPGSAPVRAVIMQPAATNTLNAIGSLTGETPYWDGVFDAVAAGYGNGTYPDTFAYLGHASLKVPGQELGFFRIWTVNSQVQSGGRIAVSLTAPGVVPGLYTIRRVRVSGFDRGDAPAPLYEVEAGPSPRFRVDSLL